MENIKTQKHTTQQNNVYMDGTCKGRQAYQREISKNSAREIITKSEVQLLTISTN